MSYEVDYLPSILGKKGYAAMDCWMPTDCTDKNDAAKFLDYLESTLDEEISPHVRVYELEDIKNRTHETIDTLIDCVYQFTHHALIGGESDAAVEFEVQHWQTCTIPDGDIELQKELLKVGHNKGVSHLLDICHTYYAGESEAAAMYPGKSSMWCRSPVNLSGNHRSIHHSARIAHASTNLDVTIALLNESVCKGVGKKDIVRQSVIPARTTNPLLQWTTNGKVCMVSMEEKGTRLTL